MEGKKKSRRRALKVYPITGSIKNRRALQSEGCKREERIIRPLLASEAAENTNRRRINAEEKPRRKSFNQMFGLPRKTLMTTPKKMKKNQMEEETRDNAEHRLKLKIGSVFIQPWLIIISTKAVIKKKATPEIKPSVKPWKEGLRGKTARIPLATQTPKNMDIILRLEGSVNKDE
jgi:hypothetical protein